VDRSESIIVDLLLLRNLDAVVDDMLSVCCSYRATDGKNSPKSRMKHVVAAGVNIAGVGGNAAAGPAPFRVAVGTVTDGGGGGGGGGASSLGML